MYLLYEYEQFLSRYAETTKKVYLDNVKLYLRFLEEYTGKQNSVIQICNVSKADIYNYVAYMDKFSKNTKEIRLASIQNFYKFLNPNLSSFLFEDIKLFNSKKKMPRILSSLQIKQLLNYYSGRNQLIIFIFLSTGIRLAELQALRIENINFERQFFTVKVKGGFLRDVHFPKKCGDMIKEYIGDKEEGNLFNLSRRGIQVIIEKAIKNLGIEGTTHSLRHTFATVMYKKTKDILLVSELLGHKTIMSTQIYAYVDNEEARNAINSNPLARYGIDED